MLFAMPLDLARMSLTLGPLAAFPAGVGGPPGAAAAPGGSGVPSSGGARARVGRGGRLILDRAHPLSYEPLNGAAHPDDGVRPIATLSFQSGAKRSLNSLCAVMQYHLHGHCVTSTVFAVDGFVSGLALTGSTGAWEALGAAMS